MKENLKWFVLNNGKKLKQYEISTLILNMLNDDVYNKLETISKKIEDGWKKNIAETNTDAHISRQGSMLTLFFSKRKKIENYEDALTLDVDKYAKYFKEMLNMGVYLPPSQYECLFLSSVLDNDDIEKLINSNMEHKLIWMLMK